ncbi:MAG: ABC transporter permease [Roseburia sp.]|nr:ABC transporter permease [Roseburia sp.]
MADNKKKSNALTNNALVKKIGGQQLVVILVMIALFIFFCVASESFGQYSTIVSIMDFSYYVTFIAIGVTFALMTGGNDLSIGTGMVCYSLIGGFLISKLGLPVGVGMIVTILCGMLMGTLNGFLVAVLELPPFIATLCTMMIVRGLGSIITGGVSLSWPAADAANGWFRSFFKMTVGNTKVPVGVVWIILAVIIMSIILTKTKPGRYIIAIGSNKEAARLSGVNVIKWHMLAYIICGFFTGLAGIAYAGTFQTLTPGTGAGLELDAICAAIIGGTSMYGGQGTIVGTLIGVFLMCILKTGLPYIGLQANWQQIIIGMVLILAVLMDVLRTKKRA